jgi:RNA polymerase sigma-54 factor
MALSQSLQQKQLLKLLPQQIQLMKLLQVPTANLEERIKEELEENPALEQSDEDAQYNEPELEGQEELGDYDSASVDELGVNNNNDGDNDLPEYDPIDLSDYDTAEDEVGDYRLKDENYPELDDAPSMPYRADTNFHDLLITQLGLLALDERRLKVAEQIVGSIDDDGYFRREISSLVDDLAFRQNIMTTDAEVEQLLKTIQNFDPPGVGARNLQECLLLQLKRLKADKKPVDNAISVIKDYFEEFTKKHYEKIERGLNLDDAGLRTIIQQIVKLNPKPGGMASDTNSAETYVIPDFYILNNNGKLELSLNAKNAPDLRISGDYKELLRNYDKGAKKDKRQKEAVLFIKQKIDAAKWFIDLIKQRQQTLYSTMYAIMMQQKEFFLTGDETTLRPMILKDIAEKTNLDISTISRVANSKFVQTEFGTYRLKYFFSESLSTDSGEEVSTREVKKILSDFVAAEDKHKPLSDDHLTEMLNERGYNIARRTVAKYREQLNVPVARLRKVL